MVGVLGKTLSKRVEMEPQAALSTEVPAGEVTVSPKLKRQKVEHKKESVDQDFIQNSKECSVSIKLDNRDRVERNTQSDSGDSALHIDENVFNFETAFSNAQDQTYVDDDVSQLELEDCPNFDERTSTNNTPSQSDESDEDQLEKESDNCDITRDHTASIHLMNAVPTNENREEALHICYNLLAKIIAVKNYSTDVNHYRIADCVYFLIWNQAQVLKLLCKKFDLEFTLTPSYNDYCKEAVETMVKYWDHEILELRDLARSCFGVLLLGGELLPAD